MNSQCLFIQLIFQSLYTKNPISILIQYIFIHPHYNGVHNVPLNLPHKNNCTIKKFQFIHSLIEWFFLTHIKEFSLV